jgi:Rrf2 family protein
MAVISTRSRYGLRLLADIAARGTAVPVDLHSIAMRQAIPEAYLARLVLPLKAAGILHSSRGAKGGYELSRSAESISLLQVVEAMEGTTALLSCTGSPGACGRSTRCKARGIWAGLEHTIREYLAHLSVADAVEDEDLLACEAGDPPDVFDLEEKDDDSLAIPDPRSDSGVSGSHIQ